MYICVCIYIYTYTPVKAITSRFNRMLPIGSPLTKKLRLKMDRACIVGVDGSLCDHVAKAPWQTQLNGTGSLKATTVGVVIPRLGPWESPQTMVQTLCDISKIASGDTKTLMVGCHQELVSRKHDVAVTVKQSVSASHIVATKDSILGSTLQ